MMIDPIALPADFVPPAYQDGSIANIPATAAALLDVPFQGLPPLREPLWRPLTGGIERVVTIIVDALGWNLLEKEPQLFEPLLERTAVTGKITSIFPSTTVAALSSIWTGVSPAQHGLVGLRMFFPEYGTIGDMLNLGPTFGRYADALVDAGLDPHTFLQWPGMAEQLAAAGVPVHAFKGRQIIHSALSRMHGRGVTGNHGVISLADMLVQMGQLLEEKAGERLFISAYWSTIDTLSHRDGWRSPTVRADLRGILNQLQVDFLDTLSPAARRGTAVFIFADHGQVEAPPNERIYLEDHPKLQSMLFMKPTGEPRVSYLYTRHGCREDVLAYCRRNFGEMMTILPTEDVLESGYFGPAPVASGAEQRLGDLVVAMHGGGILLNSRAADDEVADRMFGRHGGMTAGEMLVPWLGFRLDQ